MNKKISGRRWALAAVFVIGMLTFTGMAFAEGEDAPTVFYLWLCH